MRRIIVLFVTAIISLTFWNVKAEECSGEQIESSLNALENLTYNLEYDMNFSSTINGKKNNGYFKVSFPNLPAGYAVSIKKMDGSLVLGSPNDNAHLLEGVYQINVFSNMCDSLKVFEIKIPAYKKYCSDDEECQNIWTEIQDVKQKTDTDKTSKIKIDGKLLVILAILIVILFVEAIFLLKRRRE